MRKIHILLISSIVIMLAYSCSDDESTSPAPKWEVKIDGNYDTSMSSIVALPDELKKHATDEDVIAAFMNNECRGIGELITNGDNRYYFFTIKGFTNENSKITLKYYNTKNSYQFTTGAIVEFQPDGTWGVLDNPIILDLKKE